MGLHRPPCRPVEFEHNYLRFHPHLPRSVVGSSTTALDDEVDDSTCRFVHVDGSHERAIARHRRGHGAAHVSARRRHGVRRPHEPTYPGVTAAVWGAVDQGELRPVVITTSKLYAVDPSTDVPLDTLAESATDLGLTVAHRRCCGHDTLRFELPARRGVGVGEGGDQLADAIDVIERHQWIHRQREQLAGGQLGLRALTLERPHRRLPGQGDGIVNARLDGFVSEGLADLVTRRAPDAHHQEMVDVPSCHGTRRTPCGAQDLPP